MVTARLISFQNELYGSSENGGIVGQGGEPTQFSKRVGACSEPLGLVQSRPHHGEQVVSCLSIFVVCACHGDTQACGKREVEATSAWRQLRTSAVGPIRDIRTC